MRTREELQAFCEGYLASMLTHDTLKDVSDVDDWVIWGGYDINLTGQEYTHGVGQSDLRVTAYKEGWKTTLPEPVHGFIIEGETA